MSVVDEMKTVLIVCGQKTHVIQNRLCCQISKDTKIFGVYLVLHTMSTLSLSPATPHQNNRNWNLANPDDKSASVPETVPPSLFVFPNKFGHTNDCSSFRKGLLVFSIPPTVGST